MYKLPDGHTLYVSQKLGSREYYSDEEVGGVLVWDTSLVERSTVAAALIIEADLESQEAELQ